MTDSIHASTFVSVGSRGIDKMWIRPLAASRWLFAFVGSVTLCLAPASAFASEDSSDEDLSSRQTEVKSLLKEVARRMERLADRLETAQPEEAGRLREAAERVRVSRIEESLDSIVGLLEKSSFLEALGAQDKAVNELDAILALLENRRTEDPIDRARLEAMAAALAEVGRLSDSQKELLERTRKMLGTSSEARSREALGAKLDSLAGAQSELLSENGQDSGSSAADARSLEAALSEVQALLAEEGKLGKSIDRLAAGESGGDDPARGELPPRTTDGGLGAESKESGSSPKESGSTSKESGSTSKESGSASKESGSASKESGSTSKESGSTSKESGSTSKESGSTSKESGSTSKESGSASKESSAQKESAALAQAQGLIEERAQRTEEKAREGARTAESEAAGNALESGAEALESAREAMKQAAESLSKGRSSGAREAAGKAMEKLSEAARSLSDGQKALESRSPAQRAADRQLALAREAKRLEEETARLERKLGRREGSPGTDDLREAAQALADASRAMREAAGARAAGDSKGADEKGKEALSKLGEASSRVAKEPEPPHAEALAKDSKDQDALARLTREVAKKLGESKLGESAAEKASQVGGAAESMESAADGLERQDAESAAQDQEEALTKLQAARDALEEESEELERLNREKEATDVMAELVRMKERQEVLREETVKLHGTRKPQESRRQKLAVQRTAEILAQGEDALVVQSDALAAKLALESGKVFTFILRNVGADLRQARDGLRNVETGPYVQLLQEEVVSDLTRLIESLRDELERMEEEKEAPPPPPGMEQAKPRLVPLVAELRMLRELQLEVNRRTRDLEDLRRASRDTAGDGWKKSLDRLLQKQGSVSGMVGEILEEFRKVAAEGGPEGGPEGEESGTEEDRGREEGGRVEGERASSSR